MGPQQVLRAALVAGAVLATTVDAAPRLGDRGAVIDLGPANDQVRAKLGPGNLGAAPAPNAGFGLELGRLQSTRDLNDEEVEGIGLPGHDGRPPTCELHDQRQVDVNEQRPDRRVEPRCLTEDHPQAPYSRRGDRPRQELHVVRQLCASMRQSCAVSGGAER